MLRVMMVGLMAVTLFTGCPGKPAGDGGSGDDTEVADGEDSGGEETPASELVEFPKDTATATITGVVKFGKAKAPKRRKLPMSSDKACEEAHSGKPVLDESIVLNDDKTLRNCFVYIKKGLGKYKFEPPKEPVEFDQVGCVYIPHVAGAMVDQEVKFKNSDPTSHNVHTFPKKNEAINVSQTKGAVDTWVPDTPEVAVKVKCDIHAWMSSYVCVVRHPFYAVTGDGGSFSLGKLPPGEYVVGIWHERLGTQEMTVTIADGESKAIEFVFK